MSKNSTSVMRAAREKDPPEGGGKNWVPSKRNSLHLGTVELVGTEFKQTP